MLTDKVHALIGRVSNAAQLAGNCSRVTGSFKFFLEGTTYSLPLPTC